MSSSRLLLQFAFALGVFSPLLAAAPEVQNGAGAASVLTALGFDFDPETVTTDQLRRCRVFSEPLVPTREPSISDNAKLAATLLSYSRQSNLADTAALHAFLRESPQSAWFPSLSLQLARVDYNQGHYSRALDGYARVRASTASAGSPEVAAIYNLATGYYAKLIARVGRVDELDALLSDPLLATRQPVGLAAEMIAQSRDAVWTMKARPEISFCCGPYALNTIARRFGPADYDSSIALLYRSPRGGIALSDLVTLSRRIGVNFQAARRSAGAVIITPAVIHWKLNHYAAIMQRVGDSYIVSDPTFADGVDRRIDLGTIDEEGSGYFLVPAGSLPAGWVSVSEEEAARVFGRGNTNDSDPDATRTCPPGPGDHQVGGNDGGSPGCGGSCGMATYAFDTMLAALTVRDTPLWSNPPYGPSVAFTLSYNNKEYNSPSSYSSNFGPRWSCRWFAWISDPGDDGDFKLSGRGGGGLVFSDGHQNDTGGSGSYLAHRTSVVLPGALGVRSGSGTSAAYSITMADGSVETYSHRSELIPGDARIYLTSYQDPQGNAVTLAYDSDHRLITITDAAGGVTTLSYGPNISGVADYRVSAITAPDGRLATLTYTSDSSRRLWKITDMIGIVSEFQYIGGGDQMSALVTPYGTTSFNYAESDPFDGNSSRWRFIEARDPLGATERIEYQGVSNWMSPTLSSGDLPVMPLANNYLEYRNSFYWNKRSYSQSPNLMAGRLPESGDFAQAHLYHWLHKSTGSYTVGTLESEQSPGEPRIWYLYPGQGTADPFDFGGEPSSSYYDAVREGISNRPALVGRLVPASDGTATTVTQLSRYAYNDKGRITRYQDPKGRETRMTYDSNGVDVLKVEQLLDPVTDTWSAPLVEVTSWNANHQPLAVKDAAGETTTYTYNVKGQLSTVTNALLQTTTYYYHPTGQPNGAWVPNVADYGYLCRIDGPLPGSSDSINMTWNTNGLLATYLDESGYAVAMDYDELDRLLTVTYPDSTTEEIVYDRLDEHFVQDRAGHLTQLIHDALRRVTQIIGPTGKVVQYNWCPCGALDSMVDQLGRATTFLYDARGRISHRIYPLADASATTQDTVVYDFDSIGRLKSLTDGRGQVTTFHYTVDNRLAAKIHTNSVEPIDDTYLTYDDIWPRLERVDDMSGSTIRRSLAYAYHPLGSTGAGRVASVDGPISGQTISYSYDVIGRLASRTAAGATESFGFDDLGRVDLVVNALGTFNYAWVGASSRLDQVWRSGGLRTVFAYYGASKDFRLQSSTLERDGSASLVARHSYDYDVIGDITRWTMIQPSATELTYNQEWRMGYAATGELTSVTLPDVTYLGAPTDNLGLSGNFSYTYDAAGNRISEQRSTSGGFATSTTALVSSEYNRLNQLTDSAAGGDVRIAGTLDEAATVSVTPGDEPVYVTGEHEFETFRPVTAAAASSFTVTATDGSGNSRSLAFSLVVDSVPSRSYTYDANGNLSDDRQPGGTASEQRFYHWDANNEIVAWGNDTATLGRFVYDGFGRRIQETTPGGVVVKQWLWDGMELVAELDDAGNVTKRYFTEGFQTVNGSTVASYYYYRDHLGSVRAVYDADNTFQAGFTFDPYGRRTQIYGTLSVDIGYAGYYYHAGIGLDLTSFRAYDSGLGRWLSLDPLGDIAGPNMYAYVNSDPINLIDPLGLSPCASELRLVEDNDKKVIDSKRLLLKDQLMHRQIALKEAAAVIASAGLTVKALAECVIAKSPSCWAARAAAVTAALAVVEYGGQLDMINLQLQWDREDIVYWGRRREESWKEYLDCLKKEREKEEEECRKRQEEMNQPLTVPGLPSHYATPSS